MELIDCKNPLSVFTSAVAAINDEKWLDAAALVDPVSLRAFHRLAIRGLTELRPADVLTVDELLRHAPDTPRAVAEDWVARASREADPMYRLAREFPAIASTEQLRALTPEELFAHWLEGKSHRRRYQDLVKAGRLPAAALEHRGRGPFGGYPYVAVGSVADGDMLIHVLYRSDMLRGGRVPREALGSASSAADPDEAALQRELMGRVAPYVTTLRRQPECCWRFVITDDFLHMRATNLQGVGILRHAAQGDAPTA